jgi:hypothetical protein
METKMKKALRALLLTTVLAASSGVAQPVLAQAFQFNFGFGSGEFYDGPGRLCLSGNASIRRAIARQGYKNIYLNVENDGHIQARATKGRWVYILDVNSCSGRILSRQRLRPA